MFTVIMKLQVKLLLLPYLDIMKFELKLLLFPYQ